MERGASYASERSCVHATAWLPVAFLLAVLGASRRGSRMPRVSGRAVGGCGGRGGVPRGGAGGDSMRIGSLFSGIGGLELGLEWAGVGDTVWQVEWDPWCRSILAKHWPHAERFDDVQTVGSHNLTPVELICGGFPCQDLSVAGKQHGLDGERSGLWLEFLRIVDECQPYAVVVENVAHGRGQWLPVVRRDLCDLGYGSTALQVSAADVGAPHLRERVFVVAIANTNSKSLRDLAERRSSRWARSLCGEGKAEPMDVGAIWGAPESSGWRPPPYIRRVADGLSRGLDRDRLKALGNAVVPQVAEIVGHILLEIDRAAR